MKEPLSIASAMIGGLNFPCRESYPVRPWYYLLAGDCAATGAPPNHPGCFTMTVVPIKANSKQITLICKLR